MYTLLVNLAGCFILVLLLLVLSQGDVPGALYVGFMVVPDLFLPALFAILIFRLIRAKIRIRSPSGTLALRAALLAALCLAALYVWAAVEIFYTGLEPLHLASLQTAFNDEFGVYLPVLFAWAILIPLSDRAGAGAAALTEKGAASI